MKQLIAIAFVLVFLSVPAMSQTPAQQAGDSKCTAKFAQALSIRGVHLGMSADEVFAMFPDAPNTDINRDRLKEAKTPPHFGNASLYIQPGESITAERLSGIGGITYQVFDNQIVSYSVSYENSQSSAKWDSIDQWIAKLSETLHLPGPSEWVSREDVKVLNCEGIEIQTSPRYIRLSKNSWIPEFRAREKAYEDQKRRAFQP